MSTKYQPVYHFVDEHLFSIFMEQVPRTVLLSPIRGDEVLRNRCFPGFRISDDTPTQEQIVKSRLKKTTIFCSMPSRFQFGWDMKDKLLRSKGLK